MCAYALSIIARRALTGMQALWLLRRDELDGGRVPTKPPLQRAARERLRVQPRRIHPPPESSGPPYKIRANRTKT